MSAFPRGVRQPAASAEVAPARRPDCGRPMRAVCSRVLSAGNGGWGVERVFELVKELSELPGPTGHEDAVQDWVERRWTEFAQDVRRTRVNNILARVGGAGRRLLLVAHADEICLMVKSVSDEGFLHLWPYYSDQLGRPPRWFTPLNQPALVLSSAGAVPGVFATASGHVVGGRNSQKERSEEHTSELQSRQYLVCRLLLEKKK